MLMRAATVVQVLQDLFLSFIARFILLVIAPLLAKQQGVAKYECAPTNRTTEAYIWRVFKFLID